MGVVRRAAEKVADKAEDVVLGKAERTKQELEQAAEKITRQEKTP